MRVAIATPEYPGLTQSIGGIGTQMANLVSALASQGHEVHVAVPVQGHARSLPREGVTLHEVAPPRLGRAFPLTSLALAARFDRALRRLGPIDLVLAPEYAGLASRYAGRRRRPPLVTLLQTSLEQTLEIEAEPSDWRSLRMQQAIQARCERFQAIRSQALISCSRALLEWSRELWPRLDRIQAWVSPNAIDTVRLRDLAEGNPPPPLTDGGPLIVFPGRLEPRKGVETLAQAMRMVWDERPEVRLVLAGPDVHRSDGPMSARLMRLAGGHADQMTFLGALDQAQLMPLLAQADLVVTPSWWEAFGLAAFEPLALGKPVVATRIGGFEEFLANAGGVVLVEPRDHGALARAIVDLLADPKRLTELGLAAKDTAAEFDLHALAPRYAALLERVASL